MSTIPIRARATLTTVFAAFLLVNVIVLMMTMLAFSSDDLSLLPPRLGEDVPIGLRLGLVVAGCVISYFSAGALYRMMVNAFVPPSDAIGGSVSLMSYLVIIVAAYAFLGIGAWLWLPILFLLVMIWSMVALWGLIGSGSMIGVIVAASIGLVLTWFLMS